MTGTLINVGTVLAGGTIGSLIGNRFPSGVRKTVLQGIGLATLVIGLQQVLPTASILLVVASLALGTIVGELLRIEAGLERLGELAQRAVARGPHRRPFDKLRAGSLPGDEGEAHEPVAPNPQSPAPNTRPLSPAQGFITASLIFCVGPLTILGSFEEGLTGVFQTLALKATLDGFTAALLASTMGWGVLLSAATVLVYQGTLTLGAGLLRGLLSDAMIREMNAVGGLLILGIGFNLLEVARIRVGNMLPALAIAPALAAAVGS